MYLTTAYHRLLPPALVVMVVAGCTQINVDQPVTQSRSEETSGTALSVSVADERILPPAAARAWLRDAVGDPESYRAATRILVQEQAFINEPLSAGNKAEILSDGPATFERLYELIDGAREEVLVTFFIFANDEVGRRFAVKLLDAVARGVRVHVIFDALGSVGTPGAFFDNLRDGGVDVRTANPLDPLNEPRLWRLHNRNHRKLVVVDNQQVVLGGVNVTAQYASSSAINPGRDRGYDEGWRDTSVHIEGPVVARYRALFARSWKDMGGEALPPSEHEPGPAGRLLVRLLRSNGGDDDEFDSYQAYLNAVVRAQKRIWLAHAYFAPNEEFVTALIEAAHRGVDVRLLLPGFIDFDIVYHASRANYDRLLRNGVRIFERNDALLHSKTAVVDSVWSTVGSANLDVRSFIHNDEVNAIVVGSDFAGRMEEVYRDDLAQASEISLKAWRDRGVLPRVLEFFSKRLNYFI